MLLPAHQVTNRGFVMTTKKLLLTTAAFAATIATPAFAQSDEQINEP